MSFITLEVDRGGRIVSQQRVCDICGSSMLNARQPDTGHPDWELSWRSYDVTLDGKQYELRQFMAIKGQIKDCCEACFHRLNIEAGTGRQGGL